MPPISKSTYVDIKSFYRQVLGNVLTETTDGAIIYAHFGEFSSTIIDCSLSLTEASLLEQGVKRASMKRTCSIFIECLQNISHHGVRDKEGKLNSFAVVSSSTEYDRVVSGNMVLADDMASINNRLTKLNSLTNTEKRKLFVETLCNDDFNQKGGAGLGFMTIAKKSDGQINFRLTPLDQNLGYFILDTKVKH